MALQVESTVLLIPPGAAQGKGVAPEAETGMEGEAAGGGNRDNAGRRKLAVATSL